MTGRNDKSAGALEITFTRTFCQGANLRALMNSGHSTPDSLDALDALKLSFKKTFGKDFSVTLLQDILAMDSAVATNGLVEWKNDQKSTYLSPETRDALCRYLDKPCIQMTVQLQKNIALHGASFSSVKHSRKNSQVIFVDPATQAQRGGEINEIFVYRLLDQGRWATDTYCSIYPFKELLPHEVQYDPYRRYPLLDIRMYYRVKEPIIVISWRDIVSHAATCPVSWPKLGENLMVVQSLDRVCFFTLTSQTTTQLFAES